jgi:UDP-N-acetyl-2-amino-2-deoxyglucuronate dehydrogenase
MASLKTAIIGSGKVSHLHAAALKALAESTFVGICGRSSDKLEAFGAQWGVPAFSDIDTMIETTGCEALVVCTPHPNHAESVVRAASRGVHVLVEKPLASSLADCDRMIAAADAGKATLSVVSQRRFYPPCQRLKEAIEAGKIGKPVLATATMYGWRDEAYYRSDPWRGTWKGEGGGVLVNQAPHPLDLMLWYMGPVDEVFGYWANLNHPYIEADDTAVAVLRFRSGALGTLLLSNSQNPALHAKLTVHGSKGASLGVQVDGGAMFIAGVSSVAEPPFNDIWTILGETSHLPTWRAEDAALFAKMDPTLYFHELQIRDFLRAAMEGRPPAVTGEDGRRTVELFTAIYRSSRDRAPVRLPLKAE